MTAAAVTVKRTGWDVILGIALAIAGLVLLGDAALATAVSVWLIGWFTLVSGVVLLVGSLFRLRSGGSWSPVLGGAVLTVIGLFIMRNPAAGAIAFTLVVGALLLSSGLTRVILGWVLPAGRWLLMISGLVSVLLGLYVLFNLGAASTQLIGILLGVQVLLEGLSLVVVGRLHPADSED